jgi:hypothetical protein
MFDNTHAHITTWVIGVILFFAAVYLHKSGKKKAMKIVHMTLRLFYLLIILTGVLLFWKHQGVFPMQYGLKLLGGLWVISMFEMILVRMNKGKSTGIFWAQLIIALIVTIYLGVWLPLGLWSLA